MGSGNKYVNSPQTAFSTPFDPDNDPACGLTKENTQEVIEELCNRISASASPGFTWGKGGSAGSGEYLRNEDVESNKAGRLVPFDGVVTDFFVNNEATSGTKILELRRRRPCQTGPFVTIGTVVLSPGDSCGISSASIPVLQGDELSVRVSNSSSDFENPIVGIIIKTDSGGGAPVENFANAVTQGWQTSSQVVNDSLTDITYDDSLENSNVATLNTSTGVLTIQRAGLYEVHYDITVDNTTGTRSMSCHNLTEDTGSGFTAIPGTFRKCYHRNATQGAGSASCTIYRQYEVGDEIKLQSEEEPNGGGALETLSDGGVIFSVKYLRVSN